MVLLRGDGGRAPLVFKLGSILRSMVRPLFPQTNSSFRPLNRRLDGYQSWLGGSGELLAIRKKKDKCAEGFGSETTVKWLSGDGEV
jgi:hypothetical protein